jgi:O-antigen/teichoic acid export membrane protein
MRLLTTDLFQAILSFGIKLLAGFASYFLFAYSSNTLGSEEFGVFSFYFSIVMLVASFFSFGQQTFLMKEIPKSVSNGDLSKEGAIYFFSSIATITGAVSGAIIFYLIVMFIDENALDIAIWGSVLSGLFCISQATMGVLRVQGYTLTAVASRDLLWRVFTVVTIFISAVYFSFNLISSNLLLLFSISLLPILTLHFYIIIKSLVSRLSADERVIQWGRWVNASFGFGLIALISSADIYAYTIVLKYLLPVEVVGGFFAAFKTVELLNIFLMAVTLVLAPYFSTLIAKSDYVGLQRKCNVALVLQSTPVVFSCALVLFFAPEFLGFFSSDYKVYSSLLRLLTIGMLINALTGATGLLLQLGGLHWRHVIYQGSALCISIAMLPVFVHYFGFNGAALSFILSKVLWNLLAIISIKRELKVDPSIFAFLNRDRRHFGVLMSDLISVRK